MEQRYTKWNRMAPLGLTIIGFGMSLVGEAITLKGQGKPFWKWFSLGTLGLIVLNSGISIFGDAVKERALYEASIPEISAGTLRQ